MSTPTPRVVLAIVALIPVVSALFGKSKPKPKPTLLSKIIPLVVLFTVLSTIGVVLYLVYKTFMSINKDVKHRLDDNNIKVSRTGAYIQLDGVSYEEYQDLTQKVFVNAWNTSETKDFKSHIWGPRDKEHRDHSLKKRTSMPTAI